MGGEEEEEGASVQSEGLINEVLVLKGERALSDKVRAGFGPADRVELRTDSADW